MQPLRFPQDLLKFLYWVFFKPFTMNRYMRQVHPSLGEDVKLYELGLHRKEHPEFQSLILLALFHILITPWIVSYFLVGMLAVFGININWFAVIVCIGISILFGILGSLVESLASGVAECVNDLRHEISEFSHS